MSTVKGSFTRLLLTVVQCGSSACLLCQLIIFPRMEDQAVHRKVVRDLHRRSNPLAVASPCVAALLLRN